MRLLIRTKIVLTCHFGDHLLAYFSLEVLNLAPSFSSQLDSALWNSGEKTGVQVVASSRELCLEWKAIFPPCIALPVSWGKTLKEKVRG